MRLRDAVLLSMLFTLDASVDAAKCGELHIKNGLVRIRGRGRLAYFKCRNGYTRYGSKAAYCLHSGNWSHTPPVCISPGCPHPGVIPNMNITTLYNGAVLRFLCVSGYNRKGPETITCDGLNWSDTVPSCGSALLFGCDFEEDLCGWSQGESDNFDWTRISGETSTKMTGPPGDHTTGSGFYIFIESSGPQKPGDVARLFSPAYPSALQNMCFAFWYHMLGLDAENAVGSLEVFIKPDSTALTDIKPVFYRDGNQGPDWHRGLFHIPEQEEYFKIVVEATRMNSFLGDIAVDDIRIFNCSEETTVTPVTSTERIVSENIPTISSTKTDSQLEISSSASQDTSEMPTSVTLSEVTIQQVSATSTTLKTTQTTMRTGTSAATTITEDTTVTPVTATEISVSENTPTVISTKTDSQFEVTGSANQGTSKMATTHFSSVTPNEVTIPQMSASSTTLKTTQTTVNTAATTIPVTLTVHVENISTSGSLEESITNSIKVANITGHPMRSKDKATIPKDVTSYVTNPTTSMLLSRSAPLLDTTSTSTVQEIIQKNLSAFPSKTENVSESKVGIFTTTLPATRISVVDMWIKNVTNQPTLYTNITTLSPVKMISKAAGNGSYTALVGGTTKIMDKVQNLSNRTTFSTSAVGIDLRKPTPVTTTATYTMTTELATTQPTTTTKELRWEKLSTLMADSTGHGSTSEHIPTVYAGPTSPSVIQGTADGSTEYRPTSSDTTVTPVTATEISVSENTPTVSSTKTDSQLKVTSSANQGTSKMATTHFSSVTPNKVTIPQMSASSTTLKTTQTTVNTGTSAATTTTEAGTPNQEDMHESNKSFIGEFELRSDISMLTKFQKSSLLQVFSKVDVINKTIVEDVIKRVANISTTITPDSSDLGNIASVVENINTSSSVTEVMVDNVLEIYNNILKAPEETLVDAQENENFANRFLKIMDTITDSLVTEPGGNATFVTDSFASVVFDLTNVTSSENLPVGLQVTEESSKSTNISTTLDFLFPGEVEKTGSSNNSSSSIVFQDSFLNALVSETAGKSVRFCMNYYSNPVLFTVGQNSSEKGLGSKVISAKILVGGEPITNLSDSKVTLAFKPTQPLDIDSQKSNYSCVYWNFAGKGNTGSWSKEGCYVSKIMDQIFCVCDHLTNFAVLLDYYGQESLETGHALTLSIITKTGLVLSIGGLTVTVLSHLLFRDKRSSADTRPQKTLFNLALAELCSWVVFLAGISQTQSHVGCIVVAALLHYFILASFMWMLAMAVLYYLLLVKVLGTNTSSYMLKTGIPAWGLPFLPVVVVLAVDVDLYKGGETYCWMSLTAFYFAFGTPVGVILLINIILYTLVVRSVCSRSVGPTKILPNRAHLRNIKASFLSFVILGLSWVFGFLAISDARVFFQYIFCITSSIQGFLIFLFFTLQDQRIREKWRICCRRARDRVLEERKRKFSLLPLSTTTGDATKTSNITDDIV